MVCVRCLSQLLRYFLCRSIKCHVKILRNYSHILTFLSISLMWLMCTVCVLLPSRYVFWCRHTNGSQLISCLLVYLSTHLSIYIIFTLSIPEYIYTLYIFMFFYEDPWYSYWKQSRCFGKEMRARNSVSNPASFSSYWLLKRKKNHDPAGTSGLSQTTVW